MDDVYELVMMARSDNKLWKSGLDSSYKTFIANKPSPNMKAVLLSILWTDICDIKWTLQWQCVISVQVCSYLTVVIEPMNNEAFYNPFCYLQLFLSLTNFTNQQTTQKTFCLKILFLKLSKWTDKYIILLAR